MDRARPSLLQALPLGTRANVAISVLVLIVATDLAAVVVDFQSISVAERLVDGERVAIGEARDIDDRLVTVGLIQFAGLVLAAITFLIWWSRAYKNAIAMGIPHPRYTTGWAVGWWFVPFANLVIPKNVANDIYRGSDPDMPYRDPGWRQRPVSPLLHWWWGLWILSTIVDRIAAPDDLNPNTAEDFLTLMRVSLVADLVEIIAAGLAIGVVLKITRRSEERRRRFPDGIPGGIPPAPPPPPAQRNLPVSPPPPPPASRSQPPPL